MDVPRGDQLGLFLHQKGIVSNPDLWNRYYNPIGALNVYLASLSAAERRRQAEMLVSQPIFSVEESAYGGTLPARQQIIAAAAAQHNLEPELVTAFILAEQRDQSALESAVEYTAAVSVVQHSSSIGLGQVTIATAQNYDLFADLLSWETRQNLSHKEVASLLASDEINVFATARYIRIVADQGASTAPSAIPYTLQDFPGLDLGAYSGHSSTWSEANIRALGSEYTTPMWDNGAQADSPGWGYFVYESYEDAKASGVFP